MMLIPEYHSLKAETHEGTIEVAVSIDGSSRLMPKIRMEPHVLGRLVEAFFSGELSFMSFDEHPKRLTGMSVTRVDKIPAVKLTARSLGDDDQLPADWENSDPQFFGALHGTDR
ncbi:hypothetical protein [Paracoccus sp. IB05]|uniref:hypothetical protein n=1 Tax=Paracoccus sp. IB05 TaxID=2779367 RepID=UPI0018E9088E|nr:hypothetical protein [Paracoccus sp. IB05]MBJ2152665.1 hypothetical protein [Paracoccus sp. IB05]